MGWSYNQWYLEMDEQPRDGDGHLHAASMAIPRYLLGKANIFRDQESVQEFAKQLEEVLGGKYQVIEVCRPHNIDCIIISVAADFLEPVIGLAKYPTLELSKEQAQLIRATFD